MVSRREEDERDRARLEETYGPAGQPRLPAVTTSGVPQSPTLAVRLPLSASEVVERLRASTLTTPLRIDAEWRVPAYAHRGELLVDDSGPHMRLWERPTVDEYQGILKARLTVRAYADVAVVQLLDKYSGGCELVIAWELHPKTRRFRRYRYAQALSLALLCVAFIVLGAGTVTFVAILSLLVPIYLFELGRNAARDAFDAAAVIEDVLAQSEDPEAGSEIRVVRRRGPTPNVVLGS